MKIKISGKQSNTLKRSKAHVTENQAKKNTTSHKAKSKQMFRLSSASRFVVPQTHSQVKNLRPMATPAVLFDYLHI